MKFTVYKYTPLDATVVNVNPNEKWSYDQNVAAMGYGIYMYSGDMSYIAGCSTPGVKAPLPHWFPSDASTNWLSGDPEITGPFAATSQASADGASYLCLSRNGSGERQIAIMDVNGSATLPAGQGFVVADAGPMQADGATVPQFGYFAPRDYDVTITGNGNILTVQ